MTRGSDVMSCCTLRNLINTTGMWALPTPSSLLVLDCLSQDYVAFRLEDKRYQISNFELSSTWVWSAIICCAKMEGVPLGENTMYILRIMQLLIGFSTEFESLALGVGKCCYGANCGAWLVMFPVIPPLVVVSFLDPTLSWGKEVWWISTLFLVL